MFQISRDYQARVSEEAHETEVVGRRDDERQLVGRGHSVHVGEVHGRVPDAGEGRVQDAGEGAVPGQLPGRLFGNELPLSAGSLVEKLLSSPWLEETLY